MFSLWCAGKLGNCPEVAKKRFRFTCLYCRWRRAYYGKWKKPPYFIDYTYTSLVTSRLCDAFIHDGKEYRRADGGKFLHTFYLTCWIDPRGHFTQLRCCAIIVLDKIMKLFAKDDVKQFHVKKGWLWKPLAELCELLANYPTW